MEEIEMKTLINTLTGLAALAVMSVGLGSCTILLAPTPSSVYIDDVYGMRPAAQVVTVQQHTTAPSTADNSQGYSDNSQGYSDTDVSSYDGNAESYTDDGSVEDIIVDDSYTARIYRFHRPSYCRSYYDVAIIDPWYSDWYWSFGYHYNSPATVCLTIILTGAHLIMDTLGGDTITTIIRRAITAIITTIPTAITTGTATIIITAISTVAMPAHTTASTTTTCLIPTDTEVVARVVTTAVIILVTRAAVVRAV